MSENTVFRLLDTTVRLGEGLSGWVARNRRTLVNANPRVEFEAAGDAHEAPWRLARSRATRGIISPGLGPADGQRPDCERPVDCGRFCCLPWRICSLMRL